MAAAFPPAEQAGLAWVALVPLLLAVGTAPPRRAWRLGLLAGLSFWLLTLRWLLRLTVTSPAPTVVVAIGWFALSAYCAMYTGLFSVTASWLRRVATEEGLTGRLVLLCGWPVAWVGFEYIRSNLFQGFAWNALGVSQFRNPALIQTADSWGVYGVSVLVALGNAALALTLRRYWPWRPGRPYRPHVELFVAMMAVAIALQAGIMRLRSLPEPGAVLGVGVVQPAIPQEQKWTESQADFILTRLEELSRQLLEARPRPELIVWPETATPDCLRAPGPSAQLVSRLAANGVPLLIGTMDMVSINPQEWESFNASFLVGPEGPLGRYDKQHLVPFGEYIPLDNRIKWLRRLAPLGWSCTPGKRPTVFRVSRTSFSVLICFEDTVASLARRFVKEGARLLVNQTNDAWFDETAAPVQHLSHSVFRAVENRVPLVRCANTGISCWIDPAGRIHEATVNGAGRPPLPMAAVWWIPTPPDGQRLSPYTRRGDWMLGRPCAGAAVLGFLLALAQARRKTPSTVRRMAMEDIST